MSSPKTRPTDASVDDFIAQVTDERRRADCRAVMALMQRASGAAPVMWGSSIVGFGAYRVSYANGDELAWPLLGFSPRKTDLTLYVAPAVLASTTTLERLGKAKTGKTCLYIKRLADVDSGVLQELIEASVASMAGKRVH